MAYLCVFTFVQYVQFEGLPCAYSISLCLQMFSSFHQHHPTRNPFPVSDPFLTVTTSLPDSCSSVLKPPFKYTKCRSLPRSSNGRKRATGLGVMDKVVRDSRTLFFFFLLTSQRILYFCYLRDNLLILPITLFVPGSSPQSPCMSDLPKTFPDTLEIPRVQTNKPTEKKKASNKSQVTS